WTAPREAGGAGWRPARGEVRGCLRSFRPFWLLGSSSSLRPAVPDRQWGAAARTTPHHCTTYPRGYQSARSIVITYCVWMENTRATSFVKLTKSSLAPYLSASTVRSSLFAPWPLLMMNMFFPFTLVPAAVLRDPLSR